MSIRTDVSTETTDPFCLSPEQSAELLRPGPWQRLAVMGDSFAAGVGSSCPGYAEQSWPERVESALRATRPDLAYLNTGTAGARTRQVLDEQLQQVLAFDPDLVNVAAGGNDLLTAEPDLDGVEADLDTIYRALTRRQAQIFAFTVVNVFDNPAMAVLRERVMALNDRIRTVAARYDATLVEMWDHPVRTAPDLIGIDGVHFSMHGHAVLAAEIVKSLSGRTA